MKRSFTASAVAALFIAFTSPLAAQWPLHPVGVPKGPDGKTNLAAPAPRAADGKPDFSGVWMISGNNLGAVFSGGLPFPGIGTLFVDPTGWVLLSGTLGPPAAGQHPSSSEVLFGPIISHSSMGATVFAQAATFSGSGVRLSTGIIIWLD